jgi:hypothetical protein
LTADFGLYFITESGRDFMSSQETKLENMCIEMAVYVLWMDEIK